MHPSNNIEVNNLDRHPLFRSKDIDDAHLRIAENVSPHHIDIVKHPSLLDINFSGFHLDGISLLHVYYGAEVEVKPEHSHYYFAQTTLSGKGEVIHGNKQCQTSTADTVIVSPSVPYRMKLQKQCNRVAVGINQNTLHNHLSKLLNHEVKDELVFTLKLNNPLVWANTINYVLQQIAYEPKILNSKNLQKAYSNIILSNLLELHEHNYLTHLNAKPQHMICPQIQALIDYIHAHIKDNISIADLAAYANVSARTLQRNFIKATDTTPIAYIRNTKLNCIHEELSQINADEGITIKSILLDYGIIDFGRFAQYYRKRFGCTPKETLLKNTSGR